MLGVVLQGYLIGLQGEIHFPQHGVDVAHIEPDVAEDQGLVAAQEDGALEARVEQVILVIREAAQSHVVPELLRLISQFDQSLIELESDLRLFLVEEVGCHVCDGFDVAVLQAQGSLVAFVRKFKVVELVVDSADRDV